MKEWEKMVELYLETPCEEEDRPVEVIHHGPAYGPSYTTTSSGLSVTVDIPDLSEMKHRIRSLQISQVWILLSLIAVNVAIILGIILR